MEYKGYPIELVDDDISEAWIKDGGMRKVLNLDTDFIVLCYENNRKKGTAKVTFIGTGSCTGTKTVSFKITLKKVK